MVNILVSPLPASVRVGGASHRIRSGYRTGIQVARLADSDLDARIIAGATLMLYFGDEVPDDAGAALEAVMRFHRREIDTKSRRSQPRILDWDHDSGRIMADFRREYGIDLADPATRMHWWVFMAHFEHLSPDSEVMTAMHYRSARRPKGLKGEEAAAWDRRKKSFALPPKTQAEALAREAVMWGDG